MAIADNLICQVYPVAGETDVKNIVDGTLFTGTGTPSLVDEGSEKAWSISTGTLLERVIPTMDTNGSVDNNGATIAIRFKSTALGTDSFMQIAGARSSASTLANGLMFSRNGAGSYRGRIQGTFTTTVSSKPDGTIYTLVFRISTSSVTNSDFGKMWVNTVGRVGDAPDFTSAAGNLLTSTFDRAFINCQTNSAYRLLDLAIWDRELTDAECASVADGYRAVMPAPSGGTTPIAFTGTIPDQTFTNGQAVSVDLSTYFTGSLTPFTFARTGSALTGTGLSITSAGLLTGTATTGSVTGVTITGTDTGSNTAVSNTFNVTVNAATPVSFSGTVPDQTGAVATPYSLDLSTYFSGSLTPFTYFLLFGDLTGTGLSLNTSTGLISGTPTGAANLDLQVRATDTGTNSAVTNLFALDITAATPVSFTGTIPAITGTQNAAITPVDTSTYFSGSLTPFTYSLFSGTLPSGVTLNSSTGVISGTPTVSFSGNIVVRATDTGSNTADSNSISVTIAAATATFTTGVLRRRVGGGVVANTAMTYFRLYNPTTGALVLNRTDLSSDANGRVTCTDAALTAGVEYKADWLAATGETRMSKKAAT